MLAASASNCVHWSPCFDKRRSRITLSRENPEPTKSHIRVAHHRRWTGASSLEEFAARLRLVQWFDLQDTWKTAELENVLSCALALVVPSLAGEVFGMVIAENMLRGKAIVASDLGAFSEVLDNAGLKFRTGDAFDLSARISELIEIPC